MTHALKKGNKDRQIFDSLTTAVLIFDRNFTLSAVNAAGEDLLALSARKVCGLPVGQLLPDSAALAEVLCRALASGQTITEWEMELHLPGPRSVLVDCSVTPVYEPAGTTMLAVELINLERYQRIQQEERLLAQQDVASAMLRGIAHEIKNPLGGIRGAAQLLERELADPALKEYTQIVIQEVDRLRKLLDSILAAQPVPQPIRLNIHEVLDHVRRLVNAESPAGVEIVRNFDPSLPDLCADRDHLVQAFLNMVRNAVQVIAEAGQGGGTVTLRTRAQRQFTIGNTRYKLVIRIDVIDDGPGVPAEILDRIFFPLVTSRAGGVGLGLSIAHSLIHKNGGLIQCSSRPGETIFSTWLPTEAPPWNV